MDLVEVQAGKLDEITEKAERDEGGECASCSHLIYGITHLCYYLSNNHFHSETGTGRVTCNNINFNLPRKRTGYAIGKLHSTDLPVAPVGQCYRHSLLIPGSWVRISSKSRDPRCFRRISRSGK